MTELTQPFGHSTSGNHERYKSHERLEWEKEYDCLRKMRDWIMERGLSTAQELDKLEEVDVIARKKQTYEHRRGFTYVLSIKYNDKTRRLIEALDISSDREIGRRRQRPKRARGPC